MRIALVVQAVLAMVVSGMEPPADVWNFQQQSDFLGVPMTAQVTLQEPRRERAWDDPRSMRSCKCSDAWQLPLVGPFCVFGQLGVDAEETVFEGVDLSGQTGLTCKLYLPEGIELQFRGGRTLACPNLLCPVRPEEQTNWLLELAARWPLLAGLGLEYQGSAVPAATAENQDLITQELRLAVPLLQWGGQMRVGARHRWDYGEEALPWSEGMQFFLGVELKR